FEVATEFIELAGKINQQMPQFCVERIERPLNDVEKPVKGSQIAILGVSYKGGVGDTRESPALRIMHRLRERGGLIAYHDPFVPTLPELGLESVELEFVESADVVVLVTAHPGVDYRSIAERTRLFVDLRGVTRGVHDESVIRLEGRAGGRLYRSGTPGRPSLRSGLPQRTTDGRTDRD